MELSSLVFSATTTELERASTVIAALVQDMSRVSVASANMARIQAQTEAILARAATESAKARKENARAADIEIKTIIAADKADAARAESIRKAAEAERRRTEATEESTRAGQRNVSILQRQSDILEFQAQGWSKGQSSILATAKAANIAADEMEKLQKVLETQRKLMGSSPFDNSLSGLTSLKNQYGELRESIRQYNTDSNLTAKQTKELARDKERLIEKMKTESASFSEIRAAVRAHNDEYVKLAGQYNNLAQAEANVIKNRKAVASATDYLTQADQKLAAALNTSNTAIDRSGTDLLVKYETALRKSGVAQDVATQKLAAYKAQLVQVQGQEEQRRAQHLTRSLTPQISDVVVSLWSGQNPLTVLLQQGAQVNDLFQLSGVAAEDFAKTVRSAMTSMVPAMMTVATGVAEVLGGMFVDAGKSVLDFISDITGISAAVEQAQRWIVAAGEANFRWIGFMQRFGETATKVMAVGLLALVTTMVAVAMKYKEIIQSENELSKALALNGGAMDMTKESAIAYADSMKQVGIGNLKAQESMTAFINAGAVGAETMDAAREAAVALEKYAGIALSDTAKEFAKLQDEPSKALIEIAKNTGQVEKATLDVISALEKEQGASAAAAAATVYAADAKKKAADEIKASLSPIETLWRDIKSAIGQVGQAVYDLATSNEVVNGMRRVWQTVAVIISETWFVIKGVGKEIRGIAAQLGAVMSGDFAGAASIGESMRADAQAARVEHDKLIASIMTKGDVEKKQFTANKAQNSEYAEWLEKNSKALAKSQSKEEQFAIKKKQLQEDLKKDLIDEVKYNEALAGWKRVIMGEDKKPKATPKDTFYETSMTKFRDASIEASDATKELTKSQIELMQTVADPKFAKLSEQKKVDILQSGAAAIAIEKQKEATIALGKAEDFREKVLGKSQGLGKQYAADMESLMKFAKAAGWTTEEIEELTRAIFKSTPAYTNYQKTIDRMTEALRKFTESSVAYQSSTNAENQELDHRISLLGKTSEEQRKLQIEYQREMKINTARYDLEKKLRDIAKEKAEAMKDGVIDPRLLSKFADAEVQAQQDAAERIKVINKGVAVEYASDLDKEIRAVQQGISDSIVTALFEGGKEGSKKLRNVLVDTLRKKVTIFVDAVVNTLMGGVVSNLLGGGSGGGTGSNLLGMANNASSLNTLYGAGSQYLFGGTAGASSASLGYANAVGYAGGDSIGALYAANGGWAGVGTGTTSVAGGAGSSAVGGLGATGVGLIVAAVLAAILWEDDAGTLHTGSKSQYSKAGGLDTYKGGWDTDPSVPMFSTNPDGSLKVNGTFDPGKRDNAVYGLGDFAINGGAGRASAESAKFVEGIAQGLVTTLDEVAVTFGKKAGFEVATAFADDTSKDGAWGALRISQEGKDLINWKDTQTSKWAPKEFSNGEDGIKEYQAALAKDTRQVLLDMDLPSWADTLLNKIGEAPTMEQLSSTLGQIGQIQTMFVQLGNTITGFAGMSDKAFESLLRTSGGTEVFTQNINSFYQEFYTESERLENSTKMLSAEFTKAGVEMPKTRDEFKALLLAQFAAGEEGAELAATLLKLSPAFAEITPAAATASRQLVGINKILSSFNIKEAFKDVDFTEVTKGLFESIGVSVEEYSNSIAGVIKGVITGKIEAEDAGKALADAAVGGITDAIAQGASQAIAAQFVSSIISPVIANIMAGKAALDGIDMQAGLANLKNGSEALKVVLNTVGPELANAFSGLGTAVVNGANSTVQMIANTAKFAGIQTPTHVPSGQSDSAGVVNPTPSLFAGVQGGGGLTPEPAVIAVSALVSETLESNKKVSELLQKLLNPKKEYANRYLELGDEYKDKRKTYRVDEFTAKIPDIVGQISALQAEWDAAIAEGVEFLPKNYKLMIDQLTIDLNWNKNEVVKLEKELRGWYLAQSRLIAVEDMTELSEEIASAKSKTAELKRTGGLTDPVTELKESFGSKLQGITEGVNKVLQDEITSISGDLLDYKDLDAFMTASTRVGGTISFDWKEGVLSGIGKVPADLQTAINEVFDELGVSKDYTYRSAHQAQFMRLLRDKITNAEDALEAMTEEQRGYLDNLNEWYRAQADLLSTEMLVDINNQIKELQKSEEGPITAIKSVITKYIEDLTELGTLDATAQASIDKLSGLQLTKARKGLYDQLLSPEEVNTRDAFDLNMEFVSLGKVIPDTAHGLRDMIDAANAAGNTTLADKLLELVPAFLSVQNAADGAGNALEKAKSATDAAYAALEKAVEAQRSILNETITNLKAVFDAAKNAAKTLYGEVLDVKKQSAAAGNAFITQALQDLKTSGVVPDGVKLQDAIDSAMQGLSSEVYDSSFAEQRGRLILAGKLTTIADLTEPQLTVAEKQLKDLDAILETARKQIDELRGINTSVLSVADAIKALAAAIAAEKATTPKVGGTSGGSAPFMHNGHMTGGVSVSPVGGTGGSATNSAINSIYQQLFGRDAEAAGADYWNSTGLTGAALETAIRGGALNDDKSKLPGFDVGINNVPYDMPAYLHAGESVIPSEFNPFNPSASTPLSLTPIGTSGVNQTQDNSDIIEENRLLRQELQAQNGAMVRLLSKVARVVERWDGDGIPEARTEAA